MTPGSTDPGLAGVRPARGRLRRYAFAVAGVGSVGLAGVGVVVPGMPTTVFLIVASWCFARSCPWLAEKLIHNRVFGPFVRYLEPGAVMPPRAKAVAMVIMWAAIAASCFLIASGGAPWFVPLILVASGLVGTWFIARQGRRVRRGIQPCGVGVGVAVGVGVRTHRHPVGRTQRVHGAPSSPAKAAGQA